MSKKPIIITPKPLTLSWKVRPPTIRISPYARHIGNMKPSRLKSARQYQPPFAELGGFLSEKQEGRPYREGRGPVDDIREALHAGDVEPFFLALRSFRSDALRALLLDTEISRIVQSWEQQTDSGDQEAKRRLERIGSELARATNRGPQISTETKTQNVKNSKQINNGFRSMRNQFERGIKQRLPREKIPNAVIKRYQQTSTMEPRVQQAAIGKFKKWVNAQP